MPFVYVELNLMQVCLIHLHHENMAELLFSGLFFNLFNYDWDFAEWNTGYGNEWPKKLSVGKKHKQSHNPTDCKQTLKLTRLIC